MIRSQPIALVNRLVQVCLDALSHVLRPGQILGRRFAGLRN
ncbi:MAG: hypothetical protein QOG10_2935 [Kribbellaceae bacterium]|jgi:hypothetical protein|nr:hypothetical protein [Kribbellaceae bacterium]